MADNEIVVATRYTTEGYDAAINRAQRVGQTMNNLGNSLSRLGYALKSDLLRGIGDSIEGFQALARTVSDTITLIKQVPAVGVGLAALGGAFVGSKIYDATIGQAQGTSTAKIFDQLGTLLKYGFDTDRIIQDLRLQAQSAQIDANNAVFNFKEGLSKNDPRVNAVIGQILGGFSGFLGTQKFGQLGQAASDVAAQQQQQQRIADAYSGINAKIQAATDYQNRLASASAQYNAAEFDRKMAIAKLEADISARRIAAAQSLAADLAKMDSTYYSQRLQMAQSFGLETQRAEEDHQRNMRRLQESHDKRLRKLADSRDALGLEDEMESFEDERRAAEEDYQTAQARRNQDYANQLRDMERAFQQQRQERIAAYNQQLRDIAVYNTTQRQLIAQQMRDIAKAVMDAFTQAARTYTQSNTSNTSTTNNVNMTTNVNGAGDPLMTAQLVHTEVARLFRAATL